MPGWIAHARHVAEQPGVLLQALDRGAEASGFRLGKRPYQRSGEESASLRLAPLLTVVMQASQREQRQGDVRASARRGGFGPRDACGREVVG
ncbi:hypothetical protein Y882_17855 [Dyella japonica DSM 16301]|uniref:Uncharacterized protein n=1 Tax=Dyella japonica DSM 16301 TaxID=1440762 RepID=A0A0G9H2W4_9GAMM|nr:hypothetical protein Y882_17855 [Dyella japonica DSM 16301]